MEQTVVEPSINISKIAKGSPSETGDLCGTSHKHDILVKLFSHVGRPDAFLVHEKQACSCKEYHWDNVPVVFLFSELAAVVCHV